MSKSSASRYIAQVLTVIVGSIGPRIIKMPTTYEGWKEIADGFKEIRQMPNIAGAIYGTLIEIERPDDHMGMQRCLSHRQASIAERITRHLIYKES